MKTGSSQDDRKRGFAGWFLAVRRVMGDLAAALPAFGLAEGGDVAGAAEFFAQARRKAATGGPRPGA